MDTSSKKPTIRSNSNEPKAPNSFVGGGESECLTDASIQLQEDLEFYDHCIIDKKKGWGKTIEYEFKKGKK